MSYSEDRAQRLAADLLPLWMEGCSCFSGVSVKNYGCRAGFCWIVKENGVPSTFPQCPEWWNPQGWEWKKEVQSNISVLYGIVTLETLFILPSFNTMEGNKDQKIISLEAFPNLRSPVPPPILILSFTPGTRCLEINWMEVNDGLWSHNYLNLSIHSTS